LLKVRWVRQIRKPGRKAHYEWNWARVSAEQWSSSVTPESSASVTPEPSASVRNTSTRLHMNQESEPGKGNRESEPSEKKRDPHGRFKRKSDCPTTTVDQLTVSHPADHDRSPADGGGYPDGSPNPTTDGQPQAAILPTAAQPPASPPHAAVFAQIRQVYPPSAHGNDWETGLTAFTKLVENGADPEFILAQAGRYAAVRNQTNEPKYTKTITHWLENGGWKLEYPDPSPLLSNHPHAAAARFGFEYWKRKGGLH
jgi:hypothetical protein